MRVQLFQVAQYTHFLCVPNEHYQALQIQKVCDLKWLFLSSRLQASCCPRCWSLRSKMRLLQSYKSRSAQGKRRYSTLLSSSDMCKDIFFFSFSFFFYCYYITAMFEDIFHSQCAVDYRHKSVVHFIVFPPNSHQMQSVYLLVLTWFLYWHWHASFISEKSIYI